MSSSRWTELRHRRGADVLAGVVMLVVSALLAWIVLTLLHMSSELTAQEQARDALAAQVQGLGARPVAGPPGSRGAPGEPGRDASSVPGPEGPSGPAGVVGPSGPAGPTGPTGAVGPSGAAGRDGADSTVPGPSGAPGAAGAPGSPGAAGAPGQPPTSWTFTSGKATYTCTRAPDFDPANPQYVCSTPSPSPSPSPSASPPGQPFATTRRR